MKQAQLNKAVDSIINGQFKQAKEQLKKVTKKTILESDLNNETKLKLLKYKGG